MGADSDGLYCVVCGVMIAMVYTVWGDDSDGLYCVWGDDSDGLYCVWGDDSDGLYCVG